MKSYKNKDLVYADILYRYARLQAMGCTLDVQPKDKDAYRQWQGACLIYKRAVGLGLKDKMDGHGIKPPVKRNKSEKSKRNKTRKHSVKRTTPSNVAWLPRDEWDRQTEKFYKSLAWRELRYEALRNTGGCCCCCGARASDGIQLHVDHIKPRSKYPELQLDLENLQILCDDCNIGKSNYYDDNWRVKMELN
jgi:5-methylcytosine-specific restriction endonuclease McrA